MAEEISMQDIKLALAELGKFQKETAIQLSQTREILDEKFKETDDRFKKTDEKFKETDIKFKETDEKFKETDTKFKETDEQFKKTDTRIKEAFNLFTTQWGKLVESLVEGDLVNLLREKGIKIDNLSTRVRGSKNGKNYEFDIIAYNGTEIVVTEVKTTLRVNDVDKFRDKLDHIKIWMPRYSDYKIYGAVAYIKAYEKSEVYSESKGLWVIRATGNSASIINHDSFQPVIY